MCGIVGYLGEREVVPLLLDGLRRLEYRGYDSAGVVVVRDGELDAVKAEGKLDRLVEKLADHRLSGRWGLGHTRWATHGAPSERNAHPVLDAKRRIALIHNGIVENFLPLKRRLQAEGWTSSSDTDTEVVANLISSYLEDDLAAAVDKARRELEGLYAFAVVSAESESGEIIAVRQGPPLVLGIGKGEQFLASDPSALLAYTRDVIFLENGDLARLRRDGIEIQDRDGRRVARPVQRLNWDPIQAEKGGYKHFMAKEIHEQPQALQDTFAGRVDFELGTVAFDTLQLSTQEARDDRPPASARLRHLVARGADRQVPDRRAGARAGRSRLRLGVPLSRSDRRSPCAGARHHAVGRDRRHAVGDGGGAERGARLLAICNVLGSQATRISEGVVYTHAGPEIGVASTKAFTTQLVALYLLALYLRQQRGLGIEPAQLQSLAHLPQAVDETLRGEHQIEELARRYFRSENFLYLARGVNYPDRARRSSQAQGDLLHPRRGLPGGRDEARPDRPDRRGHAGRRGGHRRPGVRKGEVATCRRSRRATAWCWR